MRCASQTLRRRASRPNRLAREMKVKQHWLPVTRQQHVRGLDVEVYDHPLMCKLKHVCQARADPTDRLNIRHVSEQLPCRPGGCCWTGQGLLAVYRLKDIKTRTCRKYMRRIVAGLVWNRIACSGTSCLSYTTSRAL